ncbi:hypothetical protein [Persicobacter diffluens]|uniref:Uncharacterized protein n=1 Tax=Persicobacter diffluens TaxID=981 RepID=A0AAN4W0X5_9BACT|nr:hypothetical protein PEDI_24320 [Persicobacter diffluens]
MQNLTTKLLTLLLVVAGLFSCKSTEDELVGNGEITFNSAMHSNESTARVMGISAFVMESVETMVVTYSDGTTAIPLTFTKTNAGLYPGGDETAGTGFVTTDKVAFPAGTEIFFTDVQLFDDGGDLLAMTPKTNSILANWTKNLDPISFDESSAPAGSVFITEVALDATTKLASSAITINANEIWNVEFAAVDVTENSATDFGYMNGIIHEGNIVKRADFQITTTKLDADGKWVAVPGTLKITDSSDATIVYFEEDDSSGNYSNGFWTVGIPEGKSVTVSFTGGTISTIKYHGKADASNGKPVDVGNPITPTQNDVFDVILN